MLFKRLIKLLDSTKKVKVFAPTGIWMFPPHKEEWLEALQYPGLTVSFLAGTPHTRGEAIVAANRLNALADGRVNVRLLECSKVPCIGFVILDDIAFLGLDYSSASGYIDITTKGAIKALEDWFDNDAWAAGREYRGEVREGLNNFAFDTATA